MHWLFVLAAVVAVLCFPHFLVEAIRAEEEDKRSDNKLYACLCSAAVVFVLVMSVSVN